VRRGKKEEWDQGLRKGGTVRMESAVPKGEIHRTLKKEKTGAQTL